MDIFKFLSENNVSITISPAPYKDRVDRFYVELKDGMDFMDAPAIVGFVDLKEDSVDEFMEKLLCQLSEDKIRKEQ